jgi:hypothetical protein
MAEQSSTVTTFRAFVMLVCILLIPLAAVCGTSFPSVVKAIQNGRLPTMADFRGPSENTKSGLSDAPAFVPGRNSFSSTNTPGAMGNAPSSAFPSPPPGTSAQGFGGAGLTTASPVVPVNYEVPLGTPPSQSTTFPQNRIAENRSFAAVGSGGLSHPPSGLEISASQQNGRAADKAGDPSNPASGSSQLPSGASSSPDATIKYVHDRLKQLGATYYLLEPWGDRMDAFRFYCKVAIGGNPHVTRSFENVDRDPLKAMGTVLQQIEDWQKRG